MTKLEKLIHELRELAKDPRAANDDQISALATEAAEMLQSMSKSLGVTAEIIDGIVSTMEKLSAWQKKEKSAPTF